MHDKYYMSNLENPRFTEWTSTSLERSHRLPHVCTKNDIPQTWGVSLAGKWMIYLTPERRLCFLFDQASSLQDSELSEELLEEVLANLFFPTTSMDSQLVGQPLLNPNAMAVASFPGPYRPEPLPERMPVYLYLSVCLSIYLSSWLAG